MTVGELVEALSAYPPETVVKVGGEYGIGDVYEVYPESFHQVRREAGGRELVHMTRDLSGYDAAVVITNSD